MHHLLTTTTTTTTPTALLLQLYVGVAPLNNASWRPSRNDTSGLTCFVGAGQLTQTLRIGPNDATCACPPGGARCVYYVAVACPGTPYKNPTW